VTRVRTLGLALMLAVISAAATIAAAEIALRLRHGGLAARPSSSAGPMQMAAARTAYPSAYDPLLGYVPRAGARGTDNVWRRTVTIDADGLRENGGVRPPGVPVLVIGDSFAFGDEVDDADTWPAQLEQRLGRPVLNGGVFGYGLDQIVLRGEQLLGGVARAADVVILAILPEDVLRCEFSYRYAWKPYFTLEGGELALHNVPAPQPHEGPPGESRLRRALRGSFLADRVFRRLDPDGWAVPDSVRVHRNGAEVARRLVDRWLNAVGLEKRDALLVIQWSPQMVAAPIEGVVAQARQRGVAVLDLRDVLEPVVRARGIGAAFELHVDPGRASGVGHMNAQGNRIAAEAIAAAIQ
jgi:hypothetical protein